MVLDPAWPELFSLCLAVAPGCGVLLHRCDASTAATIAAERRPLAIIMSNGVHAKDPTEFDALARDVRAKLLRLDEEVSERELEAMLSGALRDTRDARDPGRRDEGSGRYTVIGAQRSEAIGGRGATGAEPRSAQRPATSSADPRLAQQRSETLRSTLPPPSSRAGSPASLRTPPTQGAATAAPPPGAPSSFRSPPSMRAVLPSAHAQAAPHAAPGGPRSVPPPPSVRAASLPTSAGALSGPPPSTRSPAASAPPPSSRSLQGAPPSSRRLTPPPSSRSLQGGAPLRKASIPPPSARSLPSPPSVRALSSPPPSVRSVPPGPLSGEPPSIRTMAPLSARMAPPSSVRPELSPRSGVRERGSEELDAVFEDQKLPLDALARGNSTTSR
ncbi:hypothetical protein WMF31_15645 [Sorangium sp. So ce1036]|uniref:hypothetical protein n=1 Tax=Sorangium sp. So ce1036 TaxID=3133328 RepID=UPI003F03F20E